MKLLKVIGCLSLVLGLLRLVVDGPAVAAVDLKSADPLASCFRPAQIPLGAPVTLSNLGSGAQAASLSYITDQPVAFEPVDPRLRIRLRAMAGAAALPRGTLVRVASGEFTLAQGRARLRSGTGAGAMLLDAADPVRFGHAAKASYVVAIKPVQVAPPAPGAAARLLPAGSSGTVGLRSPVALQALQPIEVRPWLLGQRENIFPVRASGQRGLSDLAIDVRHPGIRFDPAALAMAGCAWSDSAPPVPAAVASLEGASPGAGKAQLAMPSELLPAFSAIVPQTVYVALASADGGYAGYGAFTAIDRGWAGVGATLLAALLLWGCLNARRGDEKSWSAWASGLFLDANSQPSLSLFQIFFWTLITVWGLIYVFIVTGELMNLTGTMLVLLGIAGTGTVAARFLSRGSTGAPAAPAVRAPATRTEVDFAALLSTNGTFDLLKLQLFVFTLLIGAFVVWRIADSGVFPELDTETLLLLGVSQGLYIGGKAAAPATGDAAEPGRPA
ncbi:MAG TPA: hypothetical protein VF589_10315 [Allosphingosinicella sp.]|jgi:hypothetical protein